MTLLIASFLAGILTVLAPCILPVLPVVVGGSVADKSSSTKRAIVVLLSLGVSIFLFTLLLKATTALIGVPQIYWQLLSGIILLILGASFTFPKMWDTFSLKSGSALGSQKLFAEATTNESFLKPVLIGAALGPVFSSCSPTYAFIVAAILPVSFSLGLLYLSSYIFGLLLVLGAITLFGQRIIQRLGWATNPYGAFRRSIGVVLVIVAILILTGGDKALQAFILESGLYEPIETLETSFRR